MDPAVMAQTEAALTQLVKQYGKAPLARVIEGVRVSAERSWSNLPALQDPQMFFLPGLDDEPWVDPRHPGLRSTIQRIERDFAAIRDEYRSVVRQHDLLPYELQMPGARAVREQGGETNTLLPVDEWGTFSLVLRKQRVEGNWSRCPVTAALAESIWDEIGVGGALFFSVMAPRTHLPAHHDSTNVRLTAHLGLIVPPGCGIRVGAISRTWEEGKCLVFEDTFQHEVWNPGDRERVIVLIDLWHPGLTPIERDALTVLHDIVFAAAA